MVEQQLPSWSKEAELNPRHNPHDLHAIQTLEKSLSVSRPPFLVLPLLGWFLAFLLVPLSIVAFYSFCTKGIYGGVELPLTTENYLRASDWLYLRILGSSLKLAAFTTICCLFIGYPMAYVMATSSVRIRSALLVLVVVPFWTSFVVRAYATKVLLHHLPFQLANTDFAVGLGMVTNYLPFMILPLYVSLEKFDFSLIEAAKDLGASSWKIIWRILLPLTRAGIVTGVIFVFTPALGEFIIPDLLGGARTVLIGNLITDQFLKTRDWPFASALSILLMALVLISLAIYFRSEALEEGQS